MISSHRRASILPLVAGSLYLPALNRCISIANVSSLYRQHPPSKSKFLCRDGDSNASSKFREHVRKVEYKLGHLTIGAYWRLGEGEGAGTRRLRNPSSYYPNRADCSSWLRIWRVRECWSRWSALPSSCSLSLGQWGCWMCLVLQVRSVHSKLHDSAWVSTLVNIDLRIVGHRTYLL